ncbi:MAG: hypothetical protein SGCHY_005585, partial [Lobulomycetales sp.]
HNMNLLSLFLLCVMSARAQDFKPNAISTNLACSANSREQFGIEYKNENRFSVKIYLKDTGCKYVDTATVEKGATKTWTSFPGQTFIAVNSKTKEVVDSYTASKSASTWSIRAGSVKQEPEQKKLEVAKTPEPEEKKPEPPKETSEPEEQKPEPPKETPEPEEQKPEPPKEIPEPEVETPEPMPVTQPPQRVVVAPEQREETPVEEKDMAPTEIDMPDPQPEVLEETEIDRNLVSNLPETLERAVATEEEFFVPAKNPEKKAFRDPLAASKAGNGLTGSAQPLVISLCIGFALAAVATVMFLYYRRSKKREYDEEVAPSISDSGLTIV